MCTVACVSIDQWVLVCSLLVQYGRSGSPENQNRMLLLTSMKDMHSDKLFQELKNIGYHLQKPMSLPA